MAPSFVEMFAPAAAVAPTPSGETPRQDAVMDADAIKKFYKLVEKKEQFLFQITPLHTVVRCCMLSVSSFKWRISRAAGVAGLAARVNDFQHCVAGVVVDADALVLRLAELDTKVVTACSARDGRPTKFSGFPLELAQLQVDVKALDLRVAELARTLVVLEADAAPGV